MARIITLLTALVSSFPARRSERGAGAVEYLIIISVGLTIAWLARDSIVALVEGLVGNIGGDA